MTPVPKDPVPPTCRPPGARIRPRSSTGFLAADRQMEFFVSGTRFAAVVSPTMETSPDKPGGGVSSNKFPAKFLGWNQTQDPRA